MVVLYRSRECEADHDRTERSRDKAQRERERKRKRVMSAAQRCVDQVAVAVQQRDPGLLHLGPYGGDWWEIVSHRSCHS